MSMQLSMTLGISAGQTLTIEHHMPEWGAVLPRVGCDSCQRAHIVVQRPRQHHIAEVALDSLQRLAARRCAAAAAPALPRCFPHL